MQCMPETARIWLSPASERSESACTESPLRSPVKMAVRKAAVSPVKSWAIRSCMARPSSAGHQRGEPTLPAPVSGVPRDTAIRKIPLEVKVVTSSSRIFPALRSSTVSATVWPGRSSSSVSSP